MQFTNKYDISQLSYPSDLMDPIYGGNKVVFYINVAKASKFLPPPNETIDMSLLDTPRLRSTILERQVSNINAAASSIAGSALAGILGGSLVGVGGLASAGAVIGGASLWAAGDIAGTTTREQKRLSSAIALHMPQNLSIRYSADWASEDMAGAEMASVLGEDAMAMLKSLGDVKLNQLSDVPRAAKDFFNSPEAQKSGTDVKSIAASFGLANAPGGGYMSARTGLAANPKKEMVFKGTDFRTFSFDYSFFPRDEQEAANVERIIKTFKFHMHPEYMDTNSFLYLYPSEFDIEYHTGDQQNPHIHKHTSCVLTELNINYTPNGFNVFSNGMPTQINISMSFKELSSPTKESIDLGL